MAKEFKATIRFYRKMIFEETSFGITKKSSRPLTMRADIQVFKNKNDEYQGSLQMFRAYDQHPRLFGYIEDKNLDDWYMDCWIGFSDTNAVDYDGTSGYLPNEVLDLIDKNGFNTDDIRPEKGAIK